MATNQPRSVWLVRHGQTDWNRARRYLSTTDRPLTAYGIRQALALAQFFAKRQAAQDVIVHSGLSRTEQTALALAGKKTVTVISDPNWREAAHGLWEGLTYAEVMARFPGEALRRMTDPVTTAPTGGESLAASGQRILTAWAALGELYPGQRVVVVTHATPIQVVLCALTGMALADYWRWRIDLGSATGIDCYPGTSIIRTVNATPRL